MKKIIVGDIIIGADDKPFVIPEIGINHNGKLKVAFEMVDAAARAGARAVKHQTHIPGDEMSKLAKSVIPGNSDKSIYDIMEECALSEYEESELKKYVEDKGMLFFSTPFSRAAAERLEKMDVKLYKVGSGEMNNYPLLDHIASFGKPMIVSTGMNSMEQVKKAVGVLEKRNVPYALLHTTNLYPTSPRLVRLGAMQELQKEFPGVPVGLSDHTLNNNACVAAMALGAKIVERHFTDRKDRTGPDVVCSMDEKELKELLLAAEQVPLMLTGTKGPAEEEMVTINFAFSTVVAIQNIKKGETFTEKNIWVKRPGIGEILAEEYFNVIGKKTACDIPEDEHIKYNMIES